MKCPVCGEAVEKKNEYLDQPFKLAYVFNIFDRVETKYEDKISKFKCKNNHIFFIGEKKNDGSV